MLSGLIYLLLLFTSAPNVLKATSSLSCPSQTVQIGGINSDIAGCGLEGCDARYQDHYQSIEDCRDGCLSRTDCKSFTWASLNGDKNHPGKTVCTLYDSDVPNQRWEPDQIMCKASPISSTTQGPTPTTTSQGNGGDIICNSNENCTIVCDRLDSLNGCSNSIINAKYALSLHIICSSSENDFYGGCEFSTIWCPLTNECNIECVDYYACYLTKIHASYNSNQDDEFKRLLALGDQALNTYKEIGSYKDTSTRALRYGPGRSGYTAETCLKACPEYKYFSLQYYGECWCDSDWSHATMYGTATCGKTGSSWCNYIYENLGYNYSALDVGQTTFNEAFRASDTHIIRRECPACLPTHQMIYYKRISNALSFDAYSCMKVWSSGDNILGTDFNLYSSLDDALHDTNAWTYCNYDDVKVGAFRDCGPFGKVDYQWCSQDENNECYFSVYIPSTAFANNSVNVTCMDVDGSCLKTVLYANKSADVRVSCYGSGILESRYHSSCDDFTIHAEFVSNGVYLLCSDDYSCYKMNILVEDANDVHIFARGSYALSSSYIHAERANTLDIFCGSELSEYGCYKVYIFNPEYESHQDIATTIECQGHGCYKEMYTLSANGGHDLDIHMNGCGECHDVHNCLDKWTMYCGSDKASYDVLYGDVCNSTDCHCNYALNVIKSSWVDDYTTCSIFSTDYICESDTDCIIDCMQQWPDSNGCYDKVIHAENATSLTVVCDSISNAPIYGACESSHIYGPIADGAQCDIHCQNKDACYDTELSVHTLNLTCVDNACSHTNVYGASNANISIHCIATDSCIDMNVTANDAHRIQIWCQGNAMHSSYSACAQFNVFAVNVANIIQLVCKGDSSCHNVDIFANASNHVIVDVVGGYAGYYGDIYAMNAQRMDIICASGYGYYGCYNMHFYIPEAVSTNIECIGNGCNGLELYAVHGFSDINTISVDGCKQCNSVAACLSLLHMHCGKTFSIVSGWNDDECNNEMQYQWNDTWTEQTCGTFDSNNSTTPGHICANDAPCAVDCSQDAQCSKLVITGHNATSLTVNCGSRGCSTSTIYCPISSHTTCSVVCNGTSACDYAKIYADDNSIFSLNCGQLSCLSTEIHIENAFEVNIECFGSMACSYMTVIGDYAESVGLQCSGDYTHSYLSSCNDNSVYAQNANELRLSCTGDYSCANNVIYGNNAHSVWITAIGSNSIYYGSIYAANASYLSLDLSSVAGSTSGVEHINVFIPQSNTHLNCVGFGCDNMEIFAKDGMKVIDYISFDGCNECISPETCIGNWQLYCGDFSDESSATFTGSSCIEYSCDCNDLHNEIEDAWMKMGNDINDECASNNISADIICEEDTDCIIDCSTTNCKRKLIYGYKATSLSIQCDSAYACEYVNVYCAETIYSQCNVMCESHESCYSMQIHANRHNTIRLHCRLTEACANTNIYASESMDINIVCHGLTDADYASDSPCFNLKIYASLVQNSVNVECHDEYACAHTVLYAENANNVQVLGYNGYAAMEYMYIYAQNASVFELICIGETSWHGCSYANIYLPSAQSASVFKCYGRGCSYLYLYASDGMKSLSLSTILLNSCGNFICDSPSSCISEWYIYCNDWKENLEPFDTNIVFYGTSCSKYSYHCACSSYLNLLTDAFINSSSISPSECAIINQRVYSTTPEPFVPSSNNFKRKNKNKNKKWIIFVVIISSILVLCIIINIVYCRYRTRKLMRIHKQLEDGQAEGNVDVEDIAEMFDQPIDINTSPAYDGTNNAKSNNKSDLLLKDEPGDGQTTGQRTGITTYSLPTSQK